MAALRWLRTHAITLLGSTVVLIGIVLAQEANPAWGEGGALHSTWCFTHGWPIVALERTVHEGWDRRGMWLTSPVNYYWRPRGLLLNTFVSVLLVVSTATWCERIRKRRLKPYQFRISDALAAVVVFSILLTFHLHEASVYWWCANLTGDYPLLLHGGLWRLPWYARVPIYFGMACFILLALRFIGFCASKIAVRIHSRRT